MSGETVVHVDRKLTRAEHEILARTFGGRVEDRQDILPKIPKFDDAIDSLQNYSFGVDVGTVLMIALASGSAIFLKRITEEAASDIWRVLKDLVKHVAQRDKAIPVQSVQLQFSAGTHQGIEILVVVTALNVQFVDVETWDSTMNAWRGELEQRLAKARGRIDDRDTLPPERRMVLHAVIHGGSKPVWHVSR